LYISDAVVADVGVFTTFDRGAMHGGKVESTAYHHGSEKRLLAMRPDGLSVREFTPEQVLGMAARDPWIELDGTKYKQPFRAVLTRLGAQQFENYPGAFGVLDVFKLMGTPLSSTPDALRVITDKGRLATRLAQAGFPTPDTLIVPTERKLQPSDHIDGEVLVKPRTGAALSAGVMPVDPDAQIVIGPETLLQRALYCGPDGNTDVRASYVGPGVADPGPFAPPVFGEVEDCFIEASLQHGRSTPWAQREQRPYRSISANPFVREAVLNVIRAFPGLGMCSIDLLPVLRAGLRINRAGEGLESAEFHGIDNNAVVRCLENEPREVVAAIWRQMEAHVQRKAPGFISAPPGA
jgi:hypothetical protein